MAPNPLPVLHDRTPALTPSNRFSPVEAREKFDGLQERLEELTRQGVLVAFSGGVDSSFLLWAVAQVASGRVGHQVVALTTVSASTPERDRQDAARFAAELGVEQIWRSSRELDDPRYVRNDRRRCYYCKADLFRVAEELAVQRNLRWLLYGFNASDLDDVRPGHQAALEAGVLAPLAEVGLRKAEIRHLMRSFGLDLSEKPASPCLSSRVMTGIPISAARLGDVEAIEAILREGGVRVCRARICEGSGQEYFLRIEVGVGDMAKAVTLREPLVKEGLVRGYRWVTLDLAGYRTGGGVS